VKDVLVGVLSVLISWLEDCRKIPRRGIPEISSRSEPDSMLFRAGSGGMGPNEDELALLTKSDQLPEDVRNILRRLGRLPCFCGDGTRFSGGEAISETMTEKDERDVGYWFCSDAGVIGVIGERGGELRECGLGIVISSRAWRLLVEDELFKVRRKFTIPDSPFLFLPILDCDCDG
jgi:hypothetical protein